MVAAGSRSAALPPPIEAILRAPDASLSPGIRIMRELEASPRQVWGVVIQSDPCGGYTDHDVAWARWR